MIAAVCRILDYVTTNSSPWLSLAELKMSLPDQFLTPLQPTYCTCLFFHFCIPKTKFALEMQTLSWNRQKLGSGKEEREQRIIVRDIEEMARYLNGSCCLRWSLPWGKCRFQLKCCCRNLKRTFNGCDLKRISIDALKVEASLAQGQQKRL